MEWPKQILCSWLLDPSTICELESVRSSTYRKLEVHKQRENKMHMVLYILWWGCGYGDGTFEGYLAKLAKRKEACNPMPWNFDGSQILR